MIPKLFIGPVSKNVVDATIEFSNENKIWLGLIPSRRQIDYDGGYVNNWNTKTFSEYVNRLHGKKILLQRDHGGIGQGKENKNDDYISFAVDSIYFDLIHIDPFKDMNIDDGIDYTIYWIKKLVHPRIKFEIGTESAICPFTLDKFKLLLKRVSDNGLLNKIQYAVIQSGTSLSENSNTGHYNENILKEMIRVCKFYEVLSKEHNGDYLSTELIKRKFNLGLDSINIAPEFGMLESICYIDTIKKYNPELLSVFYNICYASGKWKKWVPVGFNFDDKEKLIKICGHYVLSTLDFIENIREKLPIIDEKIKFEIKKRIKEICL